MNNCVLAKEMKQYLIDCQRKLEADRETAIEHAQKNLIKMGYINENLDVLPPYNGEKVNDKDFSLGPNEFQYVKLNKRRINEHNRMFKGE